MSGRIVFDLDHEVKSDRLDFPTELIGIDSFGYDQSCVGLEKALPGPRGMAAVGRQFDDIDPEFGEGAGDRTYDALAILTHHLKRQRESGLRFGINAPGVMDAGLQSRTFQYSESFVQTGEGLFVDHDLYHSRKLTGKTQHPAALPVA